MILYKITRNNMYIMLFMFLTNNKIHLSELCLINNYTFSINIDYLAII